MAGNKVELCGVNTAKLPLLKEEEKEELLARIKEGDEDAREQYIKGNLRLVLSVIKRFSSSSENADDLFQIGCVGLMKAVDHFDPSRLVKFSTYAVPMITGEIKRFLRDDGMIKVSRSLKELSYKAYLKQEELQEKNGRDPTIEELAEALSVSTEDLTMAMEASGDIESLQKSIYQKDGQEIRLMDKLPGEKREEERILDHLLLNDLLNTLGSKERKIIYLRYFANHTQSQIGKVLGISQVQVSRMEKQILKKMRENV